MLIDREKKINYKELTGVARESNVKTLENLCFEGVTEDNAKKHQPFNLLKRNIDLSTHLMKLFLHKKEV